MKIAIVGSREYPNLEEVRKYIRTLPRDTIIVSGGAKGVDRTAAEEARKRGLGVVEYLADWDTFGKSAGLIRNQTIVDSCDELVAFWDGKSRGTVDSIRKAQNQKKPVWIVLPP